MINIDRTMPSPASLQTQAVRDYLDELADWKKDYSDRLAAHQIDKSLPKPLSKFEAKNTPAYRSSDLIDAFDDCFLAKCYLTEEAFANSGVMDVEHFLSKSERPDLRYEWSNLYPAEHLANMMKPRKIPDGGYLDPCSSEDDVEQDILYSFEEPVKGIPKCHFEARDPKNKKAVNTAQLLDRVHNGHDADSFRNTQDLRLGIDSWKRKIMHIILEWQDAKERNDQEEEMIYRKKLQDYLSRKASFTMLMRSNLTIKKLVINKGVELD